MIIVVNGLNELAHQILAPCSLTASLGALPVLAERD